MQNNGKEMYKKVCFRCKVAVLLISLKKKGAARGKLFFLLISSIVVVFLPFSLFSPLPCLYYYSILYFLRGNY